MIKERNISGTALKRQKSILSKLLKLPNSVAASVPGPN
jgi:hypothetical protein